MRNAELTTENTEFTEESQEISDVGDGDFLAGRIFKDRLMRLMLGDVGWLKSMSSLLGALKSGRSPEEMNRL